MKNINIMNNVRIVLTDNENYAIAYGKYIGSKNVAKVIEYEDLKDALILVKDYYENSENPKEPQFLDKAMDDFFQVIKELVDRIYAGDEEAWLWLQEQDGLIKEGKSLFIRAATEQECEFPFTDEEAFKRIFN